jgi:hypothetical protein
LRRGFNICTQKHLERCTRPDLLTQHTGGCRGVRQNMPGGRLEVVRLLVKGLIEVGRHRHQRRRGLCRAAHQ